MNAYVVNLYPVPNDLVLGKAVDVSNTAVSVFPDGYDAKTTCCLVTASGGDFYVTFDGSDPSSTNGHLMTVPYKDWWSREAARVARMKATGGNISHLRLTEFTY